MAKIDIALPEAIQQQLSIPLCADLRLPQAKLPQIRLPTGATIKGITDLTKGIPSDCSLNFSLAVQLAPIMASIECLVKVLAVITPLIDVIKALPGAPDPTALLKAVGKFLVAAEALAPCLLVPTPLAMIPFVADILRLLIAMLSCLVQQLQSVVDLMAGLEISIQQAHADGNTELLGTLQCAQANAQIAAQGTLQGMEPIKILLELAGAFMSIAQIPAIKLPAIGGASDVAGLKSALHSLRGVIDTMKQIVDALP
jgi:hypothetical protein